LHELVIPSLSIRDEDLLVLGHPTIHGQREGVPKVLVRRIAFHRGIVVEHVEHRAQHVSYASGVPLLDEVPEEREEEDRKRAVDGLVDFTKASEDVTDSQHQNQAILLHPRVPVASLIRPAERPAPYALDRVNEHLDRCNRLPVTAGLAVALVELVPRLPLLLHLLNQRLVLQEVKLLLRPVQRRWYGSGQSSYVISKL